MDSQTSLARTLDTAMWKGSARADEFPHRCPLNPNGVDRKTCVELSGMNFERNRGACCGTNRAGVEFAPCNSSERRCITCLEIGRRGKNAGVVTDEVRGLCDEHRGIAKSAAAPAQNNIVPTRVPRRSDTGQVAGQIVDHPKPAPPPPAPKPPAPPKTSESVVPALSDAAKAIVIDQGPGKPLRIPLSRILPYKGQPRRYFSTAEVMEIADDLQQNGQETPNKIFEVPEQPGYFMLIGGERRWRGYHVIATRTKTDPLVDCFLGTVKDARDHYRKAFRDNIKRKGYIPRDEADAYKQMYDYSTLPTHEQKVEELMRDGGVSRKTIENFLLVASLPEEAKDLMNPELLDKQLVFLVALEIARATKDPAVRLELAKETSQACMGLPEAKHYIRQKTGYSRFGSGRDRRASDEYREFKEQVTGIAKRAQTLAEKWDIAGLYSARPHPEDDREKDAGVIRDLISGLEAVLQKVTGASPKPKKR